MRGRDLTTELLRRAYSHGFFPMPNEAGVIDWLRPNPRAVIPLDGFHVSRRLERRMRQGRMTATFDRCFLDVMRACGRRPSTWITPDFLRVYGQLHAEGAAHSVEVWLDDRLVGGTYGVTLGGVFFAESMFHTETDASKIALYHLVQRLNACDFRLLEVQFLTPHLRSLGAVQLPDSVYMPLLSQFLTLERRFP